MTKPRVWKTLGEQTFTWIQEHQTFPNKRRGRKPLGNLKKPAKTDAEAKKQRMDAETEGNRRRSRYSVIRETANAEISNLRRLAQILPEDQQGQIFNEENLADLFQVLFSFDEDHGVHVNLMQDNKSKGPLDIWHKFSYTPDAKKRLKRILKLSRKVIELLNNSLLSEPLAPRLHSVTLQEGGALPYLRAIYYASLQQATDEMIAQEVEKSPKPVSSPRRPEKKSTTTPV